MKYLALLSLIVSFSVSAKIISKAEVENQFRELTDSRALGCALDSYMFLDAKVTNPINLGVLFSEAVDSWRSSTDYYKLQAHYAHAGAIHQYNVHLRVKLERQDDDGSFHYRLSDAAGIDQYLVNLFNGELIYPSCLIDWSWKSNKKLWK